MPSRKLSSAERDLLEEGFHAKAEADELKCVDLELNILVRIEDVSGQGQRGEQARARPARGHLRGAAGGRST